MQSAAGLNSLPILPSPAEMTALAAQVVGEWARLPVRTLGRPVPEVYFPYEYSLFLSEPFACLMVIRGGQELASGLAKASSAGPSARDEARDAFRELCHLVAGRLCGALFPQMSLGSFLPVPSVPEEWPLAPPQVESVLSVDGFPLELRLWIRTAPTWSAVTPA
jgi:hypothetical protein